MGFNISIIANRYFNDYDHNKNSQIDYRLTDTRGNTVQKLNENLRENQRSIKKGDTYVNDTVTLSSKKLFADADANKDGTVTKKELTTHISKFDTNNSGDLELRDFVDWLFNDHPERAEYRTFIRTYPEKQVSKK